MTRSIQPRSNCVFGLILAFFMMPAVASAVDRYVAPTGSGTVCSSVSPCAVRTAISAALPGDRVLMKDGIYRGYNSMLILPTGRSGASGKPITVSAITDGAVLIDGQRSYRPVDLQSNDYWILEGFNASNGMDCVVCVSYGSDNNIVRRVIAYDAAAGGNDAIIRASGNTGNLFEDVAWFGSGRKGFGWHESCNTCTITLRRTWGRFEYSTLTYPKDSFDAFYNARNATYENVILTWDQQSGTNLAQMYGMIAQGNVDSTNRKMFVRFYGSIIYLPSGKTFTPDQFVFHNYVDEIHYRDTLVYVPPDQPSKRAMLLGDCALSHSNPTPCSTYNLSLSNVTLIGGMYSLIRSNWSMSNVKMANNLTTAYGAETPFVNSGNKGATLCKRYVQGALTAQPLWPWPMNQRIIDATRAAGKTPVDVTATIEQMLGTIPSACRGTVAITSTAPTGISAPANLRITSTTP